MMQAARANDIVLYLIIKVLNCVAIAQSYKICALFANFVRIVPMKKLLILLFCLFSFSCWAQENAVKFTFLAWGTGSTKVSYERAFTAERLPQSGELAVGWIGAGWDKLGNNPQGATVRYGHKFFLGNHDTSDPLQGLFVRPEIVGTHFHYDSAADGSRALSEMLAVLGCFGYQYTVRHFIADFWLGGGWSTGSPADTGYEHGFYVFNPSGPGDYFTFSFSIRLGVCF